MAANTAFWIRGFNTGRLEVRAENKPAVDLVNTALHAFLQKVDDNIGFCFVLPQEGTPSIRVIAKAMSAARDR